MTRVAWANNYSGIGSAFGYTTFSKKIKHELEKLELTIDPAAPVALHMVPPYYFYMARFKTNLLFTMFEYDRVPIQWHHFLDKADGIIVPCRHNKRIFSEATDTPVHICPGGVDAAQFPYVKREKKDPFVFLFLGDDNPRKGTYHVAKAWELWNERYPAEAEKSILIMKLTNAGKPQTFQQVTKNSFIDYRVLPSTERDSHTSGLPTLAACYENANAFVWPTMGEGWGLPLCEAMASGLPCIYTPYSGTTDTVTDGYGYPVPFGMKKLILAIPGTEQQLETVYAADPDINAIVDMMHEIYVNYDRALAVGYTAAQKMRQQFSWARAARELLQIIQGYA